ncbi:MAG: hypothetical protein JNK58_02305 [Phycisphaerae bacterium]|nr:hypothetical protein [Phycisphaerae bacterium]
MSLLHTYVRQIRRARRSGRRGTVLILALGVLAILSIAALSYVTVVRLERSNVAVAVRGGNYNAQSDQVVDHILDLLAADLFGNKIVRPNDVAKAALYRNGPSMFEDGDSRDVPTIDLNSFNTTANPANAPSANALLDRNSPHPAVADDAFLASTEPDWQMPLDATFRWPQITNLRSAYTYSEGEGKWVRGDGRFIDLAMWFMVPNGEYADPSLDLLDWSRIPALGRIGPTEGVDQNVFNRQMNDMSMGSVTTLGSIRPSDERQWVDTDGDLRPDARWTVIDGMNTVGGLKWVVAARIIDASSMVNLNAAIEFGGVGAYPAADMLGDGRTPADIDLPRLLENMQRSAGTPYSLPIAADRLFGGANAYEKHLLDGLGMGFVTEDSTLNGQGPPSGITTFTNWPSTPGQRTEYWNLFGQNPLFPSQRGKRGGGYSVRDLADLAGFWGTNNPGVVSRIELAMDGTELNGYLPNNSDPTYGPLRSKEGVQGVAGAPSIRHLILDTETFNPDAKPTSQQIHDSVRRLLTPVSGVGLQSPVPVLNDVPEFQGLHSLKKVRIGDAPVNNAVEPPFNPGKRDLLRNSYQSLVWALAPLATDQPLNAEARLAGAFNVDRENAHYGGFNGTETAPNFRSIARTLYPPGAFGIADPLASFAVITAASMATNLVDAIDTDAPPGMTPQYKPTVVTLYNSDSPPATGAFSSISLGRRFAQGDIADTSIPWVSASNPYLIVGLERQPFLRDITLIAVYSDASTDGIGNDDGRTGPATPAEALGSAVRIAITNPWPTPIDIGPQFQVVVPETANLIDDPNTPAPLSPLRLTLPATTILPGESKGFLWILPHTGNSWDAIHDEILQKTDFMGLTSIGVISPDPAVASAVPFAHLVATPGPRGVLLTYTDPAGVLPELVIDRMRPGSGNFPEFKSTQFDFASTPTAPNNPDNFPPGFSDSSYLIGLGWDAAELAADPRWNNGVAPQFTGRVLHSTCLSRPTVQRNGGMPAVVIEAPAKNNVTTRQDALAWFYTGASGHNELVLRDDPRSIVLSLFGVTGITFPGDHVRAITAGAPTFADANTPYDPPNPLLPVFQLFVPNHPLVALSDVLRIGIFAHTCRDCGDVAAANDLQNWRTVSEKLGATLEIDNADTSLGNVPNPYLGVLDPTRFILENDLDGFPTLPSTMRVPLALRVPDCFEVCAVGTQLVQGRVNLNTAPREVIESLPMIAPPYAIPGPAAGLVASTGRADLILSHRREDLRVAAEAPPGMRTGTMGKPDMDGFATPAELAVLGSWESGPGGLTGNPAAPQVGSFLELGADGAANDFSPLQLREYVAESSGYGGTAEVKPIDDPEERLALYRAVSNIATTRSDVFIAWFVLRGYDPQAVEQIRVGAGPISEYAPISIMDSALANFQPVHESRWLIVFDRSQTESGAPLTRPTDRPRVLMKVQLPTAKP